MPDFSEVHFGPRAFLDARRRELAEVARGFERIRATPLAPVIGAEIEGVDLRRPLDDATFAEVERALHEFKVVFFRDQDVTEAQQADFARRFGELEEHPFLPSPDGKPEVIRFAKDEETVGVENVWHSDVSWRRVPSLGSVLRARVVPAIGGDTLWADMESAYQGLSDELKARIESAVAVHDFVQSFGLGMSPERRAEMREKYPPAEHPVVRTHPATGRRCLYVNAIFTSHVKGLEPEESDALLRTLFRQAAVPEYQVRFRWSPHAVAFWDNRSTQHYAASDYWPQERVMDRITIVGDRPV
jgi:taurine dioxygenase